MRTFDLSPLFRSTVGFDRVSRLLDSVQQVDEQSLSYPPYNIEKLGEDQYRITMAVAGFAQDDLDITQTENALLVRGKVRQEPGERQFLHRGIAGRAFERRFHLADFIRVAGANLENGLLHVELVREVPEALKPRTIAIEAATPASRQIEQKAA